MPALDPQVESSPVPTSATPMSTVPLPSLEQVFENHTPTLPHVPKHCRVAWSSLLAPLLRDLARDIGNIRLWIMLFILPRCILFLPSRGGRGNAKATKSLVTARIKRWRDGEYAALWLEACHRAPRSTRVDHPPSLDGRCANARRARLAIAEGYLSKAAQSLLSRGLAAPSEEAYESMAAKHPTAAPPRTPDGSPPPPAEVSLEGLMRAVESFPTASAPGPSGLRPSHLREAIHSRCFTTNDRASQALLALVNRLASGQAPSAVTPFLCGATLLACHKKDGGLRPIAVGEVIRRLTSKCLSFAVRGASARLLAPTQVGVGVRGGSEAVVHALGRTLNNPSLAPSQRWTLFVDFSNAFNEVDREEMFIQSRAVMPGISAWLESCYSSPPFLRFGSRTLRSCRGVQQGDPLGPLAFALALRPLTASISRAAPSLPLHVWYLDDGTLVGAPCELLKAWRALASAGPALGLHLNPQKCKLLVPASADTRDNCLSPEIPVIREGATVLGAPLGPSLYCEQVLADRVAKIGKLVACLPDLQDAHMATTLLKSCLAFPRIAFSLRTCPPHPHSSCPGGVRQNHQGRSLYHSWVPLLGLDVG